MKPNAPAARLVRPCSTSAPVGAGRIASAASSARVPSRSIIVVGGGSPARVIVIVPDGRSPITTTVPADLDHPGARVVAEHRVGRRRARSTDRDRRRSGPCRRVCPTRSAAGVTGWRSCSPTMPTPSPVPRRPSTRCTCWPSTCSVPGSTPPPATSACRSCPVASPHRRRPTAIWAARIAVSAASRPRLEHDGTEQSSRHHRRVAAAAAFFGVEPGMPASVYTPATDLVLDAELEVEPAVARQVDAWFELGDRALARFSAALPTVQPASRTLWPEHFDLASAWPRSTTACRPETPLHAEPYLYVGPWTPRSGPFWNEPFGASVARPRSSPVEDALAFFEEGRLLASGSSYDRAADRGGGPMRLAATRAAGLAHLDLIDWLPGPRSRASTWWGRRRWVRFDPDRSDVDFVAVLDRWSQHRRRAAVACRAVHRPVGRCRASAAGLARASPAMPETCNGVYVRAVGAGPTGLRDRPAGVVHGHARSSPAMASTPTRCVEGPRRAGHRACEARTPEALGLTPAAGGPAPVEPRQPRRLLDLVGRGRVAAPPPGTCAAVDPLDGGVGCARSASPAPHDRHGRGHLQGAGRRVRARHLRSAPCTRSSPRRSPSDGASRWSRAAGNASLRRRRTAELVLEVVHDRPTSSAWLVRWFRIGRVGWAGSLM